MNKLLYGISVMLIAGLAASFVYLTIIGDSSSNTPQAENQNTPRTVQVDDASDGNQDTYSVRVSASKVTFTNVVSEYRIAFPQGWKVGTIVDDELSAVPFSDPVAQRQGEETELTQGMKMEILVQRVPSGASLDQLLEKKYSQLHPDTLVGQRDTDVDARRATEWQVDALGFSITTFVKNETNLTTIVGYIGDAAERGHYIEMYRGIVETFEYL